MTTRTIAHDMHSITKLYLDPDRLEGQKFIIGRFEQSHTRGEVAGHVVHRGRRHILEEEKHTCIN